MKQINIFIGIINLWIALPTKKNTKLKVKQIKMISHYTLTFSITQTDTFYILSPAYESRFDHLSQ